MKKVITLILIAISILVLSGCNSSDINNSEITHGFTVRQLEVMAEYAKNKKAIITSESIIETYYFEDDITRAKIIRDSEIVVDEMNRYSSEIEYLETNTIDSEYYGGVTNNSFIQEEGNKLIRYMITEESIKSSTEYPMSTDTNFKSLIEFNDDDILRFSTDFYAVIDNALTKGSDFYKIDENTYEGSVPFTNLVDKYVFNTIFSIIEDNTESGVEDSDFVNYSISFSEDNKTINISIDFDYASTESDNIYISMSENIELRIVDDVNKISLENIEYLVEGKEDSIYITEIMESNYVYTIELSELNNNWFKISLEPGTYQIIGLEGTEFDIYNLDKSIEYILDDKTEFVQDADDTSIYYINLEVDTSNTTTIEFRKIN